MVRAVGGERAIGEELSHCRAWASELEAVHERLRPHSRRRDTHDNVMAYLDALLLDVERKNSWQLAERAGLASPFAFQHVLDRAHWDETQMREALLPYLRQNLGEEDLVLVIDETGFEKKGDHSVGVQRQYTGTGGQVTNCQVAVFVAWCTPKAHALLDVALYLPKSWTEAPQRLKQAKVPDDIDFKTKPQLAEQLLQRVFDAGVRPSWVAGDVVYGISALRRYLQEQGQPHILGVKGSHKWFLGGEYQTVADYIASLDLSAWRRISAGFGVQGHRDYDWLAVRVPWEVEDGFEHWLLARRHLGEEEPAYFVVYTKVGTTFEEVCWATGQRWGRRGVLRGGQGHRRPR